MAKKKKSNEYFGGIIIEPLNAFLIVACLNDSKTIHKHLNKKKNKSTSDWLKEHLKDFPLPTGSGGVVYNQETHRPVILFVQNKERYWQFWETLMHEVHHVVYYCSRYYGFVDEPEFQAYLVEFIFKYVRKLLQ